MMNGNNDKDNNVNEMSLSSLLGRAHQQGISSTNPQLSQPILLSLDCSQQEERSNRLNDLHDVI
jgi:hypothetical protein